MILIHPYFGKEIADDDEEERKKAEEFWGFLSEEEIGNVKHCPMVDKGKGMRVEACRRAVVCVAAEDFLRERGIEYFEALKGVKERGGELEFVETEGEGHVFHLMKPGCEKGAELTAKLVAFIKKA
ncbi:uncharacterized protein A4U43_C05F26960 [Asparagus officinalis]|uniref:Alpha/beta hydrolase fold-3 domain-containing protein n=1 Tax=Asparagus officinalis TaxID=4686 RepID=A0A5P1EUS8_ASPOF|nr:uncharacterized protein A4U43_C05F26960 [Asparagus officinalis]